MEKWNLIRQQIKETINISDNETYLVKLIHNFEKQCAEQEQHPFKIVGIRGKGFLVKIYGLFGFISFYHMPWEYNSIDSWKAIYPYLKGKVLFGKIFKFEKDPLLIIIDGKVSQFKRNELIEDKYYKGLIVHKADYGVFVDIGYDFKWKCGSLVGLLHKSQFGNAELFEQTNPGETIELIFWGYNEDDRLIFGKRPELKEWHTGDIERLVDVTLPVKVIISEIGKINYLIDGVFNATLSVTRILYPGNRNQVKEAIRKLKDGDVIHCKVLKVNRTKRVLQLIWESNCEIKEVVSRNAEREIPFNTKSKLLENRIDTGVIEKLELIGKKIKIEVVKKEDNLGRIRTKYFAENKYPVKLYISNETYKIAEHEIKQIEKNLQEGEVLDGEVINVENNSLKVKWNIKEEELVRFVK